MFEIYICVAWITSMVKLLLFQIYLTVNKHLLAKIDLFPNCYCYDALPSTSNTLETVGERFPLQKIYSKERICSTNII